MTSKIEPVERFEADLTSDLKWRTAELFTWNSIVSNAQEHQVPPLLRGGLALLYAHWEGYIKSSAMRYLKHISMQNITVDVLRSELLAILIRSHIEQLSISKKPELHSKLVNQVRNNNALVQFNANQITVRTFSNLNFEVFQGIMHSIGCSADQYLESKNIIDERLLGIRNGISHGRAEYISIDDWSETRERVETILKSVRLQLSNAASQKTYLLS